VHALPPAPAATAPPLRPLPTKDDAASETRIDVSGSPFLIQAELAVGRGAAAVVDRVHRLHQGHAALGVPAARPRTRTSGAHQTAARGRASRRSASRSTPVPLDADCQFYAVAEQLFRRGVEQAPFIRSMATWWLRLNGDYSLANGTRLDEQVPEGTWDSYVDQIEDGGWGDHVTLIAIAEVFGTSVRIVSSVEGDSFVTEIQPRVLKRTRVVLLSHWLEFAYGALKATSKSRLKN
jgi:hypothetical protein